MDGRADERHERPSGWIWMKEWKNEWTNEPTNEHTDVWTNKQTNDRKKERTDEWMNESSVGALALTQLWSASEISDRWRESKVIKGTFDARDSDIWQNLW